MSEWNVLRMLEWATDYFTEKGIPSPRLSIEWLLAHVLQVKRLDLYLQFDRPLSRDELDRIKPLVLRRAKNEPLQYITGTVDFYNITLNVTRDVLIPRPETEQLVEIILQNHTGEASLEFLDIGTGSGCIALAVKKERPHWNVTAIDNSKKALQVAQENASAEGLDITFLHTGYEDFHSDNKMDIIASNPPYISESEIAGLSEQVIDYEPRNALIARDVSEVYKHLIELCGVYLNRTGSFYFEINESKTANILKLLNIASFNSRVYRDYSGKDRFIIGNF